MDVVTQVIAQPPDACWRVFTDLTTMIRWVPGLRSASLVASRDDNLPAEIRFEFLGGLAYSLMYSYDVDGRTVRWRPKFGEKGAVRGYAKFEPHADGTQMTYALEHDPGRKAAERAFDDPDVIVEAFSRFVS
jgi:hypothetical protein